MINPDTKPHSFSVPIAKLPTPPGVTRDSQKAMSVRDIWGHKDLAPLAAGATDVVMTVGPMDSAFVRLY